MSAPTAPPTSPWSATAATRISPPPAETISKPPQVFGLASGTVVNGGGEQVAFGTVSGSHVGDGGTLVAMPGAQVSGATVSSGGALVEVPGAVVTGTTVETGGAVVSTGVVVVQHTASGVDVGVYANVASGLALDNAYDHFNANEYVLSRGTALSSTEAGGLVVFADGTAVGTVLSATGYDDVESGGTA